MVELRKRKTPPPAPAPVAKKERKSKAKKATDEATDASVPAPEPTAVPAAEEAPTTAADAEPTSSGPPKVGDSITLDGFGGDIETNDGEKTSLKALVEKSEAGVVLFTYPKASTPGCTTQACLFRDSFAPLTATGLSIYGLSTDSPKANTTFKTKQNLPYTLLCDPSASLIGAIGFKKSPKGTQRGVFVVAKDGKVLAAEPGGPAPTVEVVKKLVATMGGTTTNGEKDLKKAEETAKKEEGTGAEGDSKAANTAAEVADTAEKLDGIYGDITSLTIVSQKVADTVPRSGLAIIDPRSDTSKPDQLLCSKRLMQAPSLATTHPHDLRTVFATEVSKMRAAIAHRASRMRSNSLNAAPPPRASSDYDTSYARIAASILYLSPLPAQSGLPIYILNAAAFPDAFEVDYDSLLPYVLARLPGEEELIAGTEYEIIFFAGGQPESATQEKKNGPGVGWYLQAYHVLSRATRKRLKKLWVVHERSWVRVLIEVFGTIASPKFRKKIAHISSLSTLALHVPIEVLLVPPSAYLHDRRLSPDIYAPYASGTRAFSANEPLPRNPQGQRRLPRVLRETTSFLCLESNLKTEGLFRIPAHSTMVGILREAYDRGQQFIVWKEGPTSYCQPDMDVATLNEIHQSDAYGVHLAASLIKFWYRDLKVPIFRESSYDELRPRFGAPDAGVSLEDATQMISTNSKQSCLSQTARLILTMHLLPLLSTVASQEGHNKMTAENLAICFAPALVNGSDQLADAKMSSIVKKILQAAVEHWPHGLRKACGVDPISFTRALQPPANAREYEDPLQDDWRTLDETMPSQRIDLRNMDTVQRKPALPPRPTIRTVPVVSDQNDLDQIPKRKPAPSVSSLPRYSTLIDVEPPTFTDSPTMYNESTDSSKPQTSPKKSLDGYKEPMRKPLPSEVLVVAKQRPTETSTEHPPPITQEGTITDITMDRYSFKQQLEEHMRKKPMIPSKPPSISDSLPMQRSASEGKANNDDSVFAKPTWAASSRPNSSRQNSGVQTPLAQTSATSTNVAQPAPFVPKRRTPSPGLLQRMPSFEPELQPATDTAQARPPRRLEIQQKSVEDLRKLYEERASTVAKLANAARRSSSQN